MKKPIRHFLIYGNFSPALTPKREKLFIRARVTDVILGFIAIIAVLIVALVNNNKNYGIVYFGLFAISILVWGYRIARGRTYYQLLRKDVKDGKKEAQEILKSVGVEHGKD